MDDNPASPTPEYPRGMPRWVKVLIILGIVVLLLVVAIMVALGDGHGPGVHSSVLLIGFALPDGRFIHAGPSWPTKRDGDIVASLCDRK